jgi:hypothetical protein
VRLLNVSDPITVPLSALVLPGCCIHGANEKSSPNVDASSLLVAILGLR